MCKKKLIIAPKMITNLHYHQLVVADNCTRDHSWCESYKSFEKLNFKVHTPTNLDTTKWLNEVAFG